MGFKGITGINENKTIAPIQSIPYCKEQFSRKAVLEEYYAIKRLGAGLQGEVLLVRGKEDKKLSAIKISKNSLQGDSLLKEAQAIQRVQHEHVLAIRQIHQAHGCVGVVLEYAKHGDLFEIVSNTGQLSEGVTRVYFNQLLDALEACHKQNVFHRDVKLENVLLDDNFSIKLADFGLAAITEHKDQLLSQVCGTASYLAPEVASGNDYRPGPVDIWGLGILLFILLSGFPPFQAPNARDPWYRMLMTGEYTQFWESHEKFGKFPEGAKQLMSKMFVMNPDKRITMDEIRQDSWVTQKSISKEALIADMNHRYRKFSVS